MQKVVRRIYTQKRKSTNASRLQCKSFQIFEDVQSASLNFPRIIKIPIDSGEKFVVEQLCPEPKI